MNWRSLPPLAALRAFAAFVETGNVADAGAALNVTHAAISQHLRALERHLGIALLDRSGRALELTDAGQQLAQAVTVGFGAIESVVGELIGRDAARPLHVSVTPSFAANWLMSRLADFRMRHPDIDLMIDPSAAVVELRPGGIDVSVRYGAGNWPGVESEPLIKTPIVVVGTPELLAGHDIETPDDLVGLPWLEELGTSESSTWLREHGVEHGIAGRRRAQMPGNLLTEALRRGDGLAVTTKLSVEADIAAGRLRVLFEDREEDRGYHIVTRPGILRPQARQFVAWLRRSTRQEAGGARPRPE